MKIDTNGAMLGFEEILWLSAGKLRGTVDAAEYKHVVLGLLFLKYISDAFEDRRSELETLSKDADSEYFTDGDEEWVNQTLEDRDESLIAISSVSIAAEIARLIEKISERILSIIHESSTLADIRDALLPKLLSGITHVASSDQEGVLA